ncbi:MAG: outer membrane protein, partial [Devosia sp.]|nr:outer membrane protein [Devosia sp.]
QAAAHMEAVDLFRTFADEGDNEAVQAFAAETLPTLDMHKQHIKELVAAL